MIRLPTKSPKFSVKEGTRRILRTKSKPGWSGCWGITCLSTTGKVFYSVTLSKLKYITGDNYRRHRTKIWTIHSIKWINNKLQDLQRLYKTKDRNIPDKCQVPATTGMPSSSWWNKEQLTTSQPIWTVLRGKKWV